MARTTKILGFSVPPALHQEVERVSREERRTKSELFREMFRVYERYRRQRDLEERRWVNEVIAEAQREQRENPMTREELLAESRRLARYGSRQAQRLGIKTTDAETVKLIHKQRARHNA